MMHSFRPFVGAAAAGLLLLGAGTASAEKKGKPNQIEDHGVDATARSLSEKQGEARLEQMTSRSAEGLVAERQWDGTVMLDLEGRFQNVLVVTPGPDGTPQVTCNHGEDARAAAAHAHMPAPRVTRRKAVARKPAHVAPALPAMAPALETK